MRTRVSTVRPKRYTKPRSVRLTPAENDKLTEKLAGRTFSGLVRALVNEVEIPAPTKRFRRVVHADPRVILILAGISNNLNQLAHAANAAVLRSERIGVLSELVGLRRQMEELEQMLHRDAARSSPATTGGTP